MSDVIQSTLPTQYIFHEIDTTNQDDLDAVQALIQKYKEIQKKSKYKEIKHLIPKLLYTVLIERPDSKKSVRLYFSDILPPENNNDVRIKEPGEFIDGIGWDIYTSEAFPPVQSHSIIKNTLKPKGGPSNFLKCFFIPCLAEYKVLFVTPGQQEQKQQQKLYQSKQSKFKLTVPKGTKFLLNTKAIPDQEKKVEEKHLIAAFKKNCQEENILKNGEKLTEDQQDKINLVEKQVALFAGACNNLIQQSIARDSSSEKTIIGSSPSVDPIHTVSSSNRRQRVQKDDPIHSIPIQHNQTLYSQEEFDTEALQLANLLDNKHVVQCYRKRRKRGDTPQFGDISQSLNRQEQNLLDKVPLFTALVQMSETVRDDDIKREDVVLSKSQHANHFKLKKYENRILGDTIYRFVNTSNRGKHIDILDMKPSESKGFFPELDDIVLVQIDDMEWTLQNKSKLFGTELPIIIYKKQNGGFFVGYLGDDFIQQSSFSSTETGNTIPITDDQYFTLLPYKDVQDKKNQFSLVGEIYLNRIIPV